ncbi:DUF6049 family protein [Leifsonia sp. AG29]|uniref:DUF6049 family protein n=1 Tax=Leifsonia sp. AG29 TaxID=2598860 RepID=UPI00131D2799|nr:DUF6049 family protein [Leifsonia sp. AG29]
MSGPARTLRRGASVARGLAAVVAAAASAALVLGAGLPATARPLAAPTESTLTAAGGAAVTPEAASTAHPLTASLTALNAGTLGPGQDLVVAVTVTNASRAPYHGGTVSLWLDPTAQRSRDALTAWLASDEEAAGAVSLGRADLPQLETGSSTVVRITAPAASLPFGSVTGTAVYGLGASVKAGDDSTTARTSLVWSPGATDTRSNVTVAMPIVTPSGSTGLLSADELATYTAPNGVLTRELDGLTGHSTVALGIDPMIIASIRALGNAAPPSATEWLLRLSELPNDTFPLSYADSDLTGQLQAGLSAPLQPTAFAYGLDPKNFTPAPTPIGVPQPAAPAPATPSPTPTPSAGPQLPTPQTLLAWDYTLDGIGWPADGAVRSADLAPLAAAGLTTTIVSGGNTNSAELATTPDAPIVSGNDVILASDQRLSDSLRQAAAAPNDIAWNSAMTALNSQLALTSKEGGTPRHLLVTLDRSWPSSGTQLKRTLDGLLASPWTTPSAFRALQASQPSNGHSLKDAAESSTRVAIIRTLLADEKSLGDFSTVLDDPTTLTGRTRNDLLALLAVSWRNPRADWSGAVTKSRVATQKTLASITILPTDNVNLVSAQGSIPFSVSNTLPDEAVTVVLTASPSNSRLEVDQSSKKRILADSRATVLVPVKAKVGNGQVNLSLQLYSPTGVRIGAPTIVTVDVHADWEGIGALIFGILLVLLFGFGIVRNILRRRDQRRKAGEPEEPAEGGDHG